MLEIEEFQRVAGAIREQVASVIVGQPEAVDGVLTCLIAGGHALLEGIPGVGKTSLVRAFAGTLDLDFGRIQFTPDLMPADITGTNVLSHDAGGPARVSFQAGPVFHNLLLADEINRATPKTQSALLEAMQEGTVTIANDVAAAAAAVLRARDPEPDRDAGHLPAARGPARPLPAASSRSASPPSTTSPRSSTARPRASSRRPSASPTPPRCCA